LNSNFIPLKRPSLKRDDFLSVLNAMIDKKIYPGEIYNNLENLVKDKFKLSNLIFLPSKWIAIKLFFQIEIIKKNFKKIYVSNNCDPFYYYILNEENVEIVPLDINPDNFLPLDENIEKENALLIINFPYGYPVDFENILKLNIPIFADLSGSFGVINGGKFIGNYFDYVIFSFKDEDLITCGDGALFIISDQKKYSNYIKIVEEFNLKLSDYNCALLYSQIEKLEKIRSSMKKLFLFFKSFINSDYIKIVFDKDYNESNIPNYSNFIIFKEENCDYIKEFAEKYKIEIVNLIKKPISFFLNDKKFYKNSMKIASNYFKIPFYPTLDEKSVEKISIFLKKISE